MVARAEMKSANPVPIAAHGCGRAGKVIGIEGLWRDRCNHDERTVSGQTEGGNQFLECGRSVGDFETLSVQFFALTHGGLPERGVIA